MLLQAYLACTSLFTQQQMGNNTLFMKCMNSPNNHKQHISPGNLLVTCNVLLWSWTLCAHYIYISHNRKCYFLWHDGLMSQAHTHHLFVLKPGKRIGIMQLIVMSRSSIIIRLFHAVRNSVTCEVVNIHAGK